MRQGLLPYKEIAISYPPLFLNSMYPFYALGGAQWASIPIWVSDAATAPLLFLCAEKLGGSRLALASGLGYALSPFALYYEGYVWFSSQPMTFFVLLSMFLLIGRRPVLSSLALAVAILFKQEAVFLLPGFAAYLVLRHREKVAASIAAFSATVVGVSLPFLAISAKGYLTLVSFGILGPWPGQPPPEAVTSTPVCQSVSSNASQSLMTCSLGTTSYSEVVSNSIPHATLMLDAVTYDLEVLAGIMVIPLLLVLVPVLYLLRRSRAFFPLLFAYSGIGFLVLFSMIFHPVYRYYYLPVYVLILLAAVDRKTLAVGVLAPVLSLLSPSGVFQEIVPVLAILSLGSLLDTSTMSNSGPFFDQMPPNVQAGEAES